MMNIKLRWRRLTKESRPFKARLALAALTSFAFVFTYFIFAPIDLTVQNLRFLHFGLNVVVNQFVLLGVVLFFALTLILLLFKGKLFDLFICFIFSFTLCSYIQGNFLNTDLGTLDGSNIIWNHYTADALVNLAVWLILFILPFALRYFSAKVWKNAVLFLCILMIGMQATALTLSLVSSKDQLAGDDEWTNMKFYLSTENQFELSSQENIIVFVCDSLRIDMIEEAMQDPRMKNDVFKDFTNYTNNSSNYFGTFPGANFLLTGYEYDYEKPYVDYLNDSWEANTFFDELRQAGYSNSLYLTSEEILSPVSEESVATLSRQIDNIEISSRDNVQINKKKLYENMISLSCYRHMPLATKAIFWLDTNEVNHAASIENGYQINDPAFYNKLATEGLSLQEDTPHVVYYYLQGAHSPFDMDENAQPLNTQGDRTQRVKGTLHIIEEYLVQMKALGIYDNSTIIITADHGTRTYPSPCLLIKPANAQNHQMINNDAPTEQSDLRPTVLHIAGVADYAAYGRSVLDIPEDEKRERIFYAWYLDENYPYVETNNKGWVYNVLYEYRFANRVRDHIFSPETVDEIHPIFDSFY